MCADLARREAVPRCAQEAAREAAQPQPRLRVEGERLGEVSTAAANTMEVVSSNSPERESSTAHVIINLTPSFRGNI